MILIKHHDTNFSIFSDNISVLMFHNMCVNVVMITCDFSMIGDNHHPYHVCI